MGVDAVMNLYEAMTSAGRGGAIAHTIMTYDKPAELEAWFVTASPAALGPMLNTLTIQPSEFEMTANSASGALQKTKYTQQQAFVLQQRAITRVLGWIKESASTADEAAYTRAQFEESCKRMNKFGTRPIKDGQAYCEGRYTIDSFMEIAVLQLEDRNGASARQRYKEIAASLGKNMEGQCSVYQSYNPLSPNPLIMYKPVTGII
jgi:hypothetical protein